MPILVNWEGFCCAIRAMPGTGKTWSVCQLAYLLATECAKFHDKRRDGDGPTKIVLGEVKKVKQTVIR